MMVISELALGYLTNLIYDSSKNIPKEIFDTYSKVYDKAIEEFSNKNYKLSGIQIDTFFHQKNVEKAIEKYLKNPDKLDCSDVLIQEFFELFSEEVFSCENADLILNTFFETIDAEIEKDPELRDYLKLYLAKQTYQTVQETNQGVQELSQDVKEISQTVQEIRKVVNEGRADKSRKELDTDFDESIKKYLKKIIAEDSGTGVSDVYTELSAKEILPINLKFRDKKNDKEQDFEVLKLVKKEEKLIISGESGSGKTTTLKWLNFTYATNCLEKKEEKIPIYVELNSYTKDSFYNYVKIRAKGKGISEDTLGELLDGKAILLIDSFDLLSPTDKFFPYEEISNFVSEYSNCRFVISSRPDFFESIRSDFKVAELEKLTDEKIQIFIEKYVTDRELRAILINKILNDQQLKSLLTNPMLLYLAIRVAMERKGNTEDLLPSNRSEMHEAFISGLFSHYVKTKGKNLCADRVQIKNSLKDLYFQLQCWNKVSCEYSKALEIITKHAEDPKFEKITAQCILGDCFKLGLLIRKDSEIEDTKIEYGIHQSFQEYFAAIKLKELFESGFDISEAFGHPKWEEVVVFTSEMLESVDEFIDLMLQKKGKELRSQCELFLASKCVSKASEKTKEKLCALLADKMDFKYELEKINSIESLERIGILGISIIDEVLKDGDWSVRRRAVEALRNIKSEKVVQPLIDALKDEDWSVRWDAADALGHIKSEKAVQPLIDALKDENENVQRGAADALGHIKSEKAVKTLIDALKDEDWSVRRNAADALGNIKSEKAVQSLINLLKDEDERVWFSTVMALGDIKSEKAVQPLINLLKDEDKYVRMNAADALGHIKSEQAVQPLINLLKDEDNYVRRSAADALGHIKSEKAVKTLIDALKDEDWSVRRIVTDELGNIDSEKALQLLINLPKDENENVQRRAVKALRNINSEKALQPLINLLKDKNENMQRRAVEALRNINSETVVQPLIDALKDEDWSVRRGAADALENIKSEKAVQPLIDALKDKDENVREIVAVALGNIKSEKAVQPLIDALKDKDENVRRSAAKALGNIKSEKAVQPLIDALKDEVCSVRGIVAIALGNIKSEKAVQPLIDALKDEDWSVRIGAIDALGNIRSEKAVQPLINLLKDEDLSVRWVAASALGEICTVKNKKQLENLLKSEHEFSVNTAFEILDEIEKEERSKIILFEKIIPCQLAKVDDHVNDHGTEHVRPATEGLKDAYFGGFVDKLKSATEPTTIVDYGCGEGKFLCALTTLSEGVLRNISYIGVDISTRCRYISRLTVEKYGLAQKFVNEPEFLKPEAFSKKDIITNYVFFMHVLHEIKLIYLVDLIHSLSSKVKNGGEIFILDQKELVEEERSFVLWDDEEDFKLLLSNSGYSPSTRFFITGSGKKLSSIGIKKVEDKTFTREEVEKNCLKVYRSKEKKLLEEINRNEKGNNFNELCVRYANVSRQIVEYEQKFMKT